MYADRYARPGGIKPGSLAVAIGLNGAVVAALVLSTPAVREKWRDPALVTKNIPLAEPPPPLPEPRPQPRQKAQPTPQRQPVDAPQREVETIIGDGPIVPPGPPPIPGQPKGLDAGTGTGPITPPLPILIAAAIDPRFADAFQPDYPASERRLEREGTVKIRVLIGTDGRVRQAQQVSATSEAFWRAAEQQALRKWRFKPATRDGVPEESWRTMTLTFVLKD